LLDTDGIDFDSRTGIHGISIDLSDNTDAGFYAAGSQYTVVIDAVTINTQTVRFVLGAFRIVAAESSAGTPKADVSHFGGTAGTFSGGRPEVNTTHAAGTAWGSGAITAASIASDAITAAKIADNAIDAGAIASDAITAAKIASDAITAAKIATGAITAAKFAAGAIDAAAIANGAIDAATFAADVDAEILSYIVDDATRIDASALNTAAVTSIPAILADTGTDGVVVASIAANAITATAIAADAITAAKIANGAIDAATFAADVDAEILSYLVDDATRIDASALNTASVTTIPAILVDTGTTLDGKIDLIKTETDKIASVKSKTDSLTFTVANVLDANIQRINDVAITGDGQVGTEFTV
jgi:hypothetical protein